MCVGHICELPRTGEPRRPGRDVLTMFISPSLSTRVNIVFNWYEKPKTNKEYASTVISAQSWRVQFNKARGSSDEDCDESGGGGGGRRRELKTD